jgi:hypothetical protein
MSHTATREVLEEYIADLAGNNGVEFLVGRKPIGTCDDISEEDVPTAI